MSAPAVAVVSRPSRAPETAGHTLLVVREPRASGDSSPAAWCLRGATTIGQHPAAEFAGTVDAPVALTSWDELSALREQLHLTELVIAFRAHPTSLRRIAGIASSAGLRIAVSADARGIVTMAGAGPGAAVQGLLLYPRHYTRTTQKKALGPNGIAGAVEWLLALTFAIAAVPVVLIAALAVRLDSPGPAFFVHSRIGEGGRPFRMWKLRSMVTTADGDAKSPSDTDPRVTRVGRILRPTGLDELPQLINVLRGEMRLVGPRPELPSIVTRYSSEERWRLEARPGITGTWQLHGSRGAAMHDELELDLFQVAFSSLRGDLHALAATIGFALRGIRRVALRSVAS